MEIHKCYRAILSVMKQAKIREWYCKKPAKSVNPTDLETAADCYKFDETTLIFGFIYLAANYLFKKDCSEKRINLGSLAISRNTY